MFKVFILNTIQETHDVTFFLNQPFCARQRVVIGQDNDD